MLVQIGWGHILFSAYLGIAMMLTAMSFKYYLRNPKRHPYPLTGAVRFGLLWPIFAPIAHAEMLRVWYRERTYRKWRKIVLAKRTQEATQRLS